MKKECICLLRKKYIPSRHDIGIDWQMVEFNATSALAIAGCTLASAGSVSFATGKTIIWY
jgi:hypothetical protein